MGKGLLKIVEKTPEEIETIIAAVKEVGLPDEILEVVLYGLNLIIWLPKLILEQKVTISRLKTMLFGKPSKHSKSTKPKPKSNKNEDSKHDNPSTDAVNDSVIGNSKDDSTNEITPNKPKGHGRMPHTVYTNSTEHFLSVDGYQAGMNCPSNCGGHLYQQRS